MKSRICASLCPWRIFSRTCSRRSTARSALESAIVWFWQTRQRSSDASAMTRASSAGSDAAGAASFAPAWASQASATRTTSALATLQLLDERQQRLLDDLRRERADALVADHSALVDQVGLGNAVDAVVDPDPALEVVGGRLVRVAHALQPGEAVLALVLVVHPDQRHGAVLRQLEQHGMLLAAGHAPRGPDVEHPHLAEHVALGERLFRFVQLRQLEMR